MFGNGCILEKCTFKAQEILAKDYNIESDIWSVTSYQQLYRDALAGERHNRFVPTSEQKTPYIQQALVGAQGPIVAVSDWVKEIPIMLSRYIKSPLVPLGTNGFGRSDTREALRKHFEIDAEAIVIATLSQLSQEKKIDFSVVQKAMEKYNYTSDKLDPFSI